MKKIKDKVKNVSKVKNANMSKVLHDLSKEKDLSEKLLQTSQINNVNIKFTP